MNNLWQKRREEALKELKRYGRYMFNDHLLVVFIFALGGLAFYYQQWIETLTASFPAEWVLAGVLGIAVTYSPFYSLLKEADMVYWTPMENRLKSYFKQAMRVSVLLQTLLVTVLYLVLVPLERAILETPLVVRLLTIILLATLKLCNVLYITERKQLEKEMLFVTILRTVMNIFLLWLYFGVHWIVGIVVGAVFYSILLIVKRKQSQKLFLPWERLVEEQRLHWLRFYRLANLFTDVPAIKGSTKRRAYLDFVFTIFKSVKEKPYFYLIGRTILRQDEWFGLILRLTVLGSVFLVGISSPILGSGLALLFMWLTAIQLLPLVHVHDQMVLQELYPVKSDQKQKAVLFWVKTILSFQALIYMIVHLIIHEYQHAILMLGIYVVFIIFFTSIYAPRRLSKRFEE
ncbi:ABC transporter permease [Mangrovibacillus cuniculi]|uniref:ABC transporter permease n=1 Tax=Mangrovibacillus cuniculi TaxID=2593652 RepID=A0A7S8HEZ5_9BACI|nr:ABC transporter permease [Mangrovibacillus cuniculi]QPC45996.1 ABC transporter permease [Mangrovibacillus cuniculi]